DDKDDDKGDDGDDGEEGDGDDDDDDEQDDDAQEDEENDEDDQEEGTDDEQASDEEEFIHPSLSTHDEKETRDEESFDPISKIPKNTDDEGNGEENLEMNVGREECQDEEDEEYELYRDVNINLGRGIQMGDVHQTQEFEDSHVILTLAHPDGQQQSSSVSSQFVTSMINPTPDAGIKSIFEPTSQMDVQTPTSVAPLPVYMDQRMNEAVIVAVQFQSDRFRDEAQKENDEFLKTIDENMQKIIKEHVKEQVKTSYAVATDLSEMELKKILIEKIEGNKSIHQSNEQRNLYKALVEAYESDKIILDTYEDTVTLKRCCDDDADKDEEPSAGSDRGSKRRKKERIQSQQALHKRKLPGAMASQYKGLNLNKSQQASLLQQRSKCRLPLRWKSPHIQSLKHGISHWGRKRQQFYGFAVNWESALDVYSKRRIIAVTKLKIFEWYNYKHLDWITVRRDDDKLYKFKKGDFKTLRIQDIEGMLMLLVQGKLTNLKIEERFAFNVSLRMFKAS
nr:hypothetical protein [Tanacetum cinerariifolium]